MLGFIMGLCSNFMLTPVHAHLLLTGLVLSAVNVLRCVRAS